MDLGIRGRKAIVGGASAGLGKACAMSLAREGVDLTIVALDNGLTGLTGGQPHPGSGASRSRRLADFVRACGVEPAQVQATAGAETTACLARAMQQPGVNVVIVQAPCVRHTHE